MAFTYSPALASDRDRVRLNLADTDANAYAFEDEELDGLLASEGGIRAATAAAARILYTDAIRRARRFSLNGLNIDDTAALQHIRQLITMYGGDVATLNVVPGAALPMDRGYTEVR
ncbi:MAG: hypothetical protein AAFV53_16530 [Myxococcota bacterium]